MKTSMIKRVLIFSSLVIVLSNCDKKDDSINLNVTAVKTLYEPTDGKTVELQTSASATLYFEWEPAKAEDGGMVLYDVVFDKEGGDFSNPIYKQVSDNNGGYNHATITHGQLNKIAALADIDSASTGKLVWTVFSSKGINEVKAETFRTLEITRLAGFAEIPVDVYLTGEGSEAGTDLSNASKMKAIASSEFEIYTKLTEGKSYYFTDANSGTPKQYYVENNGLREGESNSTIAKTGVYRINVDFNNASVRFTEITDIQLYFCPTDELLFSHDYQGNGVWKAASQPITFKEVVEQDLTWYDERYKFMITTKNSAGETVEEQWGTLNTTDESPSGAEDYYYIKQVETSQWDDKFKFASEMDGALVDVTLTFQPDGEYTHSVVKVGDQ